MCTADRCGACFSAWQHTYRRPAACGGLPRCVLITRLSCSDRAVIVQWSGLSTSAMQLNCSSDGQMLQVCPNILQHAKTKILHLWDIASWCRITGITLIIFLLLRLLSQFLLSCWRSQYCPCPFQLFVFWFYLDLTGLLIYLISPPYYYYRKGCAICERYLCYTPPSN